MGHMGGTRDYQREAGGRRRGPACQPRSGHAGGRRLWPGKRITARPRPPAGNVRPGPALAHGPPCTVRRGSQVHSSSAPGVRSPADSAGRRQQSGRRTQHPGVLAGCWPQLS